MLACIMDVLQEWDSQRRYCPHGKHSFLFDSVPTYTLEVYFTYSRHLSGCCLGRPGELSPGSSCLLSVVSPPVASLVSHKFLRHPQNALESPKYTRYQLHI